MGTSFANTCWPKLFPLKWLAVFGAALFVSTLIGVRARLLRPHPAPPPAPPIQGQLMVYVKYKGEVDYQRANALIYFAGPGEPLLKDRLTYVWATEPCLKMGIANAHFDLRVFPALKNKQPEGKDVYFSITWPDREKAPIRLDIDRPYPRPKP